jgi:hypothetical protein
MEARWAVFFDNLRRSNGGRRGDRGHVVWEYEPEGFEFETGVRYLPDFRLTYMRDLGGERVSRESVDWFECKPYCFLERAGMLPNKDKWNATPAPPAEDAAEWRKLMKFAEHHSLFISAGCPWECDEAMELSGGYDGAGVTGTIGTLWSMKDRPFLSSSADGAMGPGCLDIYHKAAAAAKNHQFSRG